MPENDDEQLLHRVTTELSRLTDQPVPRDLQRVTVRELADRHRRRWLPFFGGSGLILAAVATAIALLALRHPTALPVPARVPTSGPTVPAVIVTPTASPMATATPSPSMTPNPTAGWPVYHSAANRMSFKHPPGWRAFECGWVYIPANITIPGSGCPTEGAGGIILAGPGFVPSNQAFTDISNSPGAFANVKRTATKVDGIPGVRISGYEKNGVGVVGGGSSQVEYDMTVGATRYTFLAYVRWPGYAAGDITAQFDELVSTVTFDR
jgi:hypothetical protein